MLSRFSVRKPYTIVVAVILVLILGSISFINLQTDLLPSIELPYLVLMTNYIGASPEEVEMVVTRPIEQVVATASNIKNINSISRENSSIVIMEFDNDVNMDSSIIEINSGLDMIKGMWPDAIGSPMIIKMNPDMLPIGIFAVDMEDMDIVEISNFVDPRIISQLESVEGVASVNAAGLVEETIQVLINPDKIEDLNKKILDKLDKELSQAEEELSKARREISEGKGKLASEEKKQMDKLLEGERAIISAKEQMSEGEAQLDEAISELAKNKEAILEGRIEIDGKIDEMRMAEKYLLGLGDRLSQENKVQLQALEEALETLEEKKLEADQGLELIDSKLVQLMDQKASLELKKNELKTQEDQIVTGKVALASGMEEARRELEEGEAILEEKTGEFETARDQAFKKVSLDGVISKTMVSGILTAQNFSMPAGYVNGKDMEYLVKIGDKIGDIEEIGALLLFDTGQDAIGKVYLRDVADIGYKDNAEDIYAKINGNNGVVLSFQKQSNYATREVSKNIRKKMDTLTLENDKLHFTPLMDQGIYIDIVVNSVLNNLIYGGILAILILIVFLWDIRPIFVIAVSIPISLIFAIAIMYFTGVTINIISLAGLALGVGMLVDNSIVVIENIYRMRNEGMSPVKASIEGAREVSGAILASTLTTVSVFLPIVFTKGISRQLFTDMGLTIGYSLMASLIVALTLVPTMTSSMLKNTTEKEGKLFKGFIDFYERLLRWSLNHKAMVMISVVLLLGLSGFLAYSMGTAFIPEMETPQMSISLEMPKGASFDESISMSDTVMERILDIEGIETVGALQGMGMGMGMGGLGSGNGGSGSSISMYLILDENKKVGNAEIGREIEKRTEDLDCKVVVNTSNMDMSALGGSGIEVLVKGRDLDRLRELGLDISQILKATEGIDEVTVAVDDSLEEVRIRVDKERAMEEGLTVAQVFGEVSNILSKGKSVTSLSIGQKDYPVMVIDGQREDIVKEDLEDLTIKLKKEGGEKEIRIGDIAHISEEKGLSSIRRKDQERFISLRASIDRDYNIGIVSREFEKNLKNYELPDGYDIELSGENEMIKTSLRDLIYMTLLAIAFIYLIMVAQFQSLLSPFVVMFTIPLAFTGGLLALAITGYEISLISMLGFLVLSGVVVNNGIVFVDYSNQLREEDMEINEALVLAGRTRMRPILMTAITTILGLSTLSIGVGVGSEMIQPLAITAIGGLTYATLLTLLVVPVMYALLHKKKIRKIILEGDD
ncbi:MAG: efflux RND transporter permease subunit [Tissierellaceae bacterium]